MKRRKTAAVVPWTKTCTTPKMWFQVIILDIASDVDSDNSDSSVFPNPDWKDLTNRGIFENPGSEGDSDRGDLKKSDFWIIQGNWFWSETWRPIIFGFRIRSRIISEMRSGDETVIWVILKTFLLILLLPESFQDSKVFKNAVIRKNFTTGFEKMADSKSTNWLRIQYWIDSKQQKETAVKNSAKTTVSLLKIASEAKEQVIVRGADER